MPLDGEYWELQMLIRAFGSFRRSPVIRSLVLPDVPYGTRAFVRILLLFLLILCLYMPRLLACTRYIVNCEPSWLLISLLYLVLESPVQSGLLPIFGKTETKTGL